MSRRNTCTETNTMRQYRNEYPQAYRCNHNPLRSLIFRRNCATKSTLTLSSRSVLCTSSARKITGTGSHSEDLKNISTCIHHHYFNPATKSGPKQAASTTQQISSHSLTRGSSQLISACGCRLSILRISEVCRRSESTATSLNRLPAW